MSVRQRDMSDDRRLTLVAVCRRRDTEASQRSQGNDLCVVCEDVHWVPEYLYPCETQVAMHEAGLGRAIKEQSARCPLRRPTRMSTDVFELVDWDDPVNDLGEEESV